VVVCAADDDYAELAPKAKAIIGDRAILVVAGAPASQPELEAAGIKNFISVRSNVLDTLKYYIGELGIK
jgi:methylmalonyl-CoA mutase